MFRCVGNLLSPAGQRGMLTILMYHRVLAEPDPILHDEIHASMFAQHMSLLASEFNVLPLAEASQRLADGTLPARAVSITFDDGYADNERVALPILRRLGLTATFFIATGYSDGGVMFNDEIIEAVRHAASGAHDLDDLGFGPLAFDGARSRRSAAERLIDQLKYRLPGERRDMAATLRSRLRVDPPGRLMMTADQIARMHRAGMTIGAHTVSHPILATLSEASANDEIAASKRALEDIVGAPVTLFAYPNGRPGQDYTARDVRLVREAGFSAAVSTVRGVCCRGAAALELPRIGPWDRDPRRLAARLLYMCARGLAPRVLPSRAGEAL